MEEEADVRFVRVLVEVADPPSVEGGGAPNQPVDLVALREEELGEIGAVLAGNPGDQGLPRRHRPSSAAGIVRARILTSSQIDQRSM